MYAIRSYYVHADWPQCLALPAGLLDQPAGSQLDPAVRLRVAGQCRMLRFQRVGSLLVDHRIVKEAAGVRRQRRIGQLALAHGDHRVGDVSGVGRNNFV